MAVSKAGRKGREPRKGSGGRRSDNGSSKDGLGNKATVQLLQDGEGPGGLAVEHAARVGNQAAGAVVAQRKSDTMVAEHPVLRLGSKGVAVAQLQEALNAAGAQPKVDADGDFGPRTASAVRNFQKAHGLDADGIVGPKTWDTLSFAPLQLTEEPPAGKDDGFRTIKVMGKETPTEEAKAAFELAGIAFDKGDHATAVQYYRRAYSMPELTELQRFSAANNMGASLERLGDREQAIEIYQEALLFPSVEKVRRARILEALRRLRTGEEAPEGRKSDTPSPSPEERKTADEGASAEIEAGNAALAGGAAQDALAHFTAAYASRNASPGVRGKACFKAGEAHQQLGDFAKALDMYQEALAFPDTGPLKPQILERMRQARLGQPALGGGASDEMPVDEQKKVFEEAVAALDAGQYSVALDGFTRVYAVRDAKPEVRRSMAFNMGVCHQRMAHFDEAVSMFEEALGIGGDQAFTLKALDFIRQARRRQVGFGVTKGDETGEPGPPGAEERLFSAEVFYATGGTEPKGNALSTLTSLATRIQEHAKATPGGSYRVVAIGKSSSKWAGADEETADAKNAALSRERADNATAKLADLLPKNLVVVMQPDAKGDAEREQLGLPPSDNSWVERTVGIAVFFTVGAGG